MPTEITAHPTLVHAYANALEQLVRADLAADPDRYGAARTWVDLHDVCDANTYLEQADEMVGIEPRNFLDEGYLALTGTAIREVERRLWGTA